MNFKSGTGIKTRNKEQVLLVHSGTNATCSNLLICSRRLPWDMCRHHLFYRYIFCLKWNKHRNWSHDTEQTNKLPVTYLTESSGTGTNFISPWQRIKLRDLIEKYNLRQVSYIIRLFLYYINNLWNTTGTHATYFTHLDVSPLCYCYLVRSTNCEPPRFEVSSILLLLPPSGKNILFQHPTLVNSQTKFSHPHRSR